MGASSRRSQEPLWPPGPLLSCSGGGHLPVLALLLLPAAWGEMRVDVGSDPSGRDSCWTADPGVSFSVGYVCERAWARELWDSLCVLRPSLSLAECRSPLQGLLRPDEEESALAKGVRHKMSCPSL